ncbi:MAG: 7-cyano-7-deazaguanine synthase, partial [Halobacteria archaeon]|nr:7-cyano-7-deazaguanine synthase [Halobacteria archaeon]
MKCVLTSGGIDSCVLAWEVSEDDRVIPIYVRQGLAWEETELGYARRFVESFPRIEDLRVFDLPIDD